MLFDVVVEDESNRQTGRVSPIAAIALSAGRWITRSIVRNSISYHDHDMSAIFRPAEGPRLRQTRT